MQVFYLMFKHQTVALAAETEVSPSLGYPAQILPACCPNTY